MEARELGQTGLEVSRLGFGCMRLPAHTDGKINFSRATSLLREALELGVNFFDSAYIYNGGESEEAIGRAFQHCRDKVIIQTKIPFGDEEKPTEAFRKMLETQLRRLRTDTIDILLIHDLRKRKWEVNGQNFLDMATKAKEQGLIRHLGLSSHDKVENIHELIDTGHFEVILMQYNLMDLSFLPAFEYAREKGLGTEVMGPVGGGRLSETSQEILGLASGKASSSAEVCLRFVFSNPAVDVAFSGMSNSQQVKENVATAEVCEPFTDEERKKAEELLREKAKLAKLYCTNCRYCMPCPQKVAIPHIFSLMNLHRLYGLTETARERYAHLGPKHPRANNAAGCVECGECEEKCPQNIPIIEQLKECHRVLGG